MHYTKLRLQNSNLFFPRFVIFFFGKAKSACKNYVVVGERKRKNPTRHHSSLLNQAQFFLEGKILFGKFGKSSSSQVASSFFAWESGAGFKEEICSFFSKGGLNFGKVWPNVLFSIFFQLNPRVFQKEIFFAGIQTERYLTTAVVLLSLVQGRRKCCCCCCCCCCWKLLGTITD